VKCSACEARLQAYLDGDVSPGDAHAMEAHLKECAACQTLSEGLRAVEVRLEGLSGIEPRPDFAVSVMSAVAALPVPKPARIRARWFLAYIAAAWALLIWLTAARVINWQHAFASVATEMGKVAAAGSAFADIGMRLHVSTFAGAAFGVEMLVIAVGALALRRYLPRLSGWIAGAQTI
jgi:anti-sigma factor RsiW